MFRILGLLLIPLLLPLLYAVFAPKECVVPREVTDIISYRPSKWEISELRVERPKFVMQDVRFAKPVVFNVPDIIGRLKVSVVRGAKEYLLVNGFFIEKGREFNGVKFLGVKDGEVLIEIDGKVYKKRI